MPSRHPTFVPRLQYLKLTSCLLLAVAAVSSCLGRKPARYSIADSTAYEATLFRQNCAVCHGPEADGRTLEDGTKIPSLRGGEIKYRTGAEITRHITEGGNGMTPFRDQLTQREIGLLVEFVQRDLRNGQPRP